MQMLVFLALLTTRGVNALRFNMPELNDRNSIRIPKRIEALAKQFERKDVLL